MVGVNIRSGFHGLKRPAVVQEVQPKIERPVSVPLTAEEELTLDAIAPFAAILLGVVASIVMMVLMIRHPEWFPSFNDFERSCDAFFGRIPPQ